MPPADPRQPTAAPPGGGVAGAHPPDTSNAPPALGPPRASRRKWPWIVGLILAGVAAVLIVPWVRNALTSVSTDDAYVNGHVTQVAPRVAGQVTRVLVEDNNFVHKGDLLVELDPEPYQVQVSIAESMVEV